MRALVGGAFAHRRKTLAGSLALLVAGLAIGCFNAWHWVANEGNAIREEQEDADE